MDDETFEDTVEIEADTVKPAKAPKVEPTSASAIEPGAVVSLSALVPLSKAWNSASVRVVQRRLIELGYLGAGSDLSGRFGAGTLEALTEYAVRSKAKGDPLARATIEALFKGTPAKVVE